MSEHAPGPWVASHRHMHGGPTDDEMSGLGWDIEGPPEPMLRGQFAKAADARLIAAAPDLLAALIRLTDYVTASGVEEDAEDAYEDACAAIAKARGEAS